MGKAGKLESLLDLAGRRGQWAAVEVLLRHQGCGGAEMHLLVSEGL